MVRVLLAGLIAMVISIVIGPRFIRFLRRKEYGQHIRAEGPAHHVSKQGTPTAGGVLILLAALIAFLPLTFRTLPALTVAFAAVACGTIGFIDDFIKLTHQRSLGLSGRWKMLLLALTTVGVGVATHHQQLRHDIYIPVVKYWLPLSYAWYLLLFLIIAGAANGVNLTDGVDGLAAGTSIIVLFSVAAMSVTFYLRSSVNPAHRIETRLDVAVVAAALIGAAIGFLWFNAFPAEVFMGDTGSFALGGAIAAAVIMLKVELLLPVIGGIFVIVALSVIIQVFSFKRFGKRVFLMAPLQHHFEMKGWSETRIMVRFWIVTAILCSAGFALFYKYYAVPH
jgi:phospho-N-acetylmuramoyl-pentapeptide-transferase